MHQRVTIDGVHPARYRKWIIRDRTRTRAYTVRGLIRYVQRHATAAERREVAAAVERSIDAIARGEGERYPGAMVPACTIRSVRRRAEVAAIGQARRILGPVAEDAEDQVGLYLTARSLPWADPARVGRAARRAARTAAGCGRRDAVPVRSMGWRLAYRRPKEHGQRYIKYHWHNGPASGTVYHPSTRFVSVGIGWLEAWADEHACPKCGWSSGLGGRGWHIPKGMREQMEAGGGRAKCPGCGLARKEV